MLYHVSCAISTTCYFIPERAFIPGAGLRRSDDRTARPIGGCDVVTTQISGAWNLRDVADTAGIRPGRLFRSSELSALDGMGRAGLSGLGVTDVADLRSMHEVKRHGVCAVPTAVTLHQLPFDSEEIAPHEHAFERMLTEKPEDDDPVIAARRFMVDEYERFSSLPGMRTAVGRVLAMIGEQRSVLVNCFAGKDRTGVLVAVVLESVGVDQQAVNTDFLASNESSPLLRDRILRGIADRVDTAAPELVEYVRTRLTEQVLDVRPEYLAAARAKIDNQYGSLPEFLVAAGVDEEMLGRARAALCF